jgi:hypothetical protein
LLIHNPDSFLCGDEPFIQTLTLAETDHSTEQELTFEPRHEGFIGIPHGGLAMGLCLDAWKRTELVLYPVEMRCRLGGSSVKIGDTCSFMVQRSPKGEEPRFLASLTKKGENAPYMRAEIFLHSQVGTIEAIPHEPDKTFRKLPYYENCFVCGHHRDALGLQRRFRVHTSDNHILTTTPWGSVDEDFDRAAKLLVAKDELHPAVLISILDENTGWAGFMQTRSAGLSVKMNFTILRPVKQTEELLFVGWPTGIRGNPKNPRFFSASGTILSMNSSNNPEPIAFVRGEWIILEEYTKQIRRNLLPKDDWQWIFRDKDADI